MGNITNREPYQQAYYPPAPTGFTRFMRTCVLWQLYRFVAINYQDDQVAGKVASLTIGARRWNKKARQCRAFLFTPSPQFLRVRP